MLNRHVPLFLLVTMLNMVGCSRDAVPSGTQPLPAPGTVHAAGPDARPSALAGSSQVASLDGEAPDAPPAPVPVVVEPAPVAMVAFFNNSEPGEGNNDLYIQEHADFATAAVADVNTPDNEINPRLARRGTWLVFQRTVHAIPDAKLLLDLGLPAINDGAPKRRRPQQDILLYNLVTGGLRTLPGLNTEEYDEYAPDISDDGRWIVYLTNRTGYPEVRLYDVEQGQNLQVPGANRNFKDITWPSLSGDGKRLAFGASERPGEGVAIDNTGNPTGGAAFTGGALTPAQSDVYIYDLPTGTQLTPPALNTVYDEYEPMLSPDGRAMLFVSNRFGSEDILEINLDTGILDDLAHLNSRRYDEQHPLYEDDAFKDVLYQIKPMDKNLLPDMQRHHRPQRLVERLILAGAKRVARPELRAMPTGAPLP